MSCPRRQRILAKIQALKRDKPENWIAEGKRLVRMLERIDNPDCGPFNVGTEMRGRPALAPGHGFFGPCWYDKMDGGETDDDPWYEPNI